MCHITVFLSGKLSMNKIFCHFFFIQQHNRNNISVMLRRVNQLISFFSSDVCFEEWRSFKTYECVTSRVKRVRRFSWKGVRGALQSVAVKHLDSRTSNKVIDERRGKITLEQGAWNANWRVSVSTCRQIESCHALPSAHSCM